MAKMIKKIFIKANTENEQFLFGKMAKRVPNSKILQFESYTQFYIFGLILIVTKAAVSIPADLLCQFRVFEWIAVKLVETPCRLAVVVSCCARHNPLLKILQYII